MTRAWNVLRNVGGVVVLLMLGIWLAGSSQSGHMLHHGEFVKALDHFMIGVIRIFDKGSHWLTEKGR
jgi:hypothetical protein